MNKKELIQSVLTKMGYSPEVDNDGDIMFRYQMKTIYVMIGDDEEPFITLTYPQFYEIEEGEDDLVLAVCNKLTRSLKLLKVFIDQTYKNVSTTCDFYYINEESLEQNMEHALDIIGIVRTYFLHKLVEASEMDTAESE
ncbi:MAG: hypothetical protein IKO26_00145 [Paludibacteraceae bacterium]|nr:hypothetical protein [Paludibacteraceae bacterium]